MTTPTSPDRVAMFAEHRPYLFAVAYRMLGVAEDANDVLQDAWLRFNEVAVETVSRPRVYLVQVVGAADAPTSAGRATAA